MNEDIFSIEKNREIRKLQEKIERDWVLREMEEEEEEDEYELEIDEEDLENILIRREKKEQRTFKRDNRFIRRYKSISKKIIV